MKGKATEGGIKLTEVGKCKFCEITTKLMVVTVDGKRYDACEKCTSNIHRILDTLKCRYKAEYENQRMKQILNFIYREIGKQMSNEDNDRK